MSHVYSDSDQSIAKSYERIHGNGEITYVYIVSAGDRYVVIAADVDPRNYDAVAGECVAYCPTLESAQERATAYMEQRPKGIVGEQSNGGFVSKMVGALQRLNEYGNDLQEKQQQQTEDH